MHILIADDDPIHRRMIEGLLKRHGHEVTVAKDGSEAWEILQGEATPRLAILDWHMPGLDGLEVCRRLRRLEQKPYVFVILLTAMDQREDLLQGLSAGVDDYLTKPLDLPMLLARLAVGQRILDLQNHLLAAHEELRYQADHDSLTGLFNRAAILSHLHREMKRSEREGKSLAVLVADVDHFKSINDGHGHAAGDLALLEISRRISRSVRNYDWVGRFGGEEFLMVLPNCDAIGAATQAERIRECISRDPLDLSTLRIDVTISMGVASTERASDKTAGGLIRAADMALYAAKRAGRNCVRLSKDENHLYERPTVTSQIQ